MHEHRCHVSRKGEDRSSQWAETQLVTVRLYIERPWLKEPTGKRKIVDAELDTMGATDLERNI